MDLSHLAQIDFNDLKNLNWPQLIRNWVKRRDILINIVLVGATLLACTTIYTSKRQEAEKDSAQLAAMKKSQDSLKTLHAVKAELENFLNSARGEIPDDQLMRTLSDLSNKNKVSITAFSPLNKRNLNSYSITTVTLSVTADTFENLWSFINEIENSEYFLHVEKWVGQSTTRARVEIASVHIHK